MSSTIDKQEFRPITKVLESHSKWNLVSILQNLISTEKLSKENINNRDAIEIALKENWDEIIETSRTIKEFDHQFLESAKDALEANRIEVAIILIATVVEHRLNTFYREVLEAQNMLKDHEITDLIRNNNLRSKSGWLLILVSGYELYEPMHKRLNTLFELRNSIVHFKALPAESITDNVKGSHNTIKQKIESLDLNDLLAIPVDLSSVLDQAAEKIFLEEFPDFDVALEASYQLRRLNDEDKNNR